MKKAIKIHESDNVAVALIPLYAGDNACGTVISEDIPAAHKFALCDIKQGEKIIKYGFSIGVAKSDIKVGQHVHTQNVRSDLTKVDSYEYLPDFNELPKEQPAEFMGYRRDNGKVGIRNEVWIIPTVGCVSSVAKEIERGSKQFITDNIDGIYAYSHPYGCSQLGDDQLYTQRLLCALIDHPNAAAVLVLSLGCENNNLNEMKKVLGAYDEKRVKFFVCQQSADEIADGIEIVRELCKYADGFERTECNASELVIGLKCGGSDGLSGITANPLAGRVSDMLIGMGGSSILTEVPEMFGAETILMNRSRDRATFDKTVGLINDFKDYFYRYGQPIDENPSPGNKEGGITTLADKALGCTQKGGSAPVEDVLCYGQTVKKHGLSLLQSPGNDLVASCALAAAGAHIILFTTGRGTPFGSIVPTVKISSNTGLYEAKKNWIDFNAGEIAENKTIDECAYKLFDLLLSIAGGTRTKSEHLDKRDIAIFKDGVTL